MHGNTVETTATMFETIKFKYPNGVITLSKHWLEIPTIFIPALGATITVVYKEIFALWVSLTHLQSTRCLATISTVTCCTLVQLPALTHEIVLTRTDVLTNISLAPMIDAHFKKERASVSFYKSYEGACSVVFLAHENVFICHLKGKQSCTKKS